MAAIYRVDESFDSRLFEGSSCAFGVFDGVHIGHRFIIGNAGKAACESDRSDTRCLVVTFDVDPDELFHAERLKKLMTNERRIETLASLDVDGVVVLPFTKEFASLSPEEFLEHTFRCATPASIHVGTDFRFGAKASGSVKGLQAWGEHAGMQAFGYGLLLYEGKPVTSTRIRLLLAEGKVEDAAVLLKDSYRLRGSVVAGRGEGRDLGFRTANLQVPDQLLAVGEGVYACYAFVDGSRYKAAVSVGVTPTFEERSSANVEVHILDFAGDIYGDEIELSFEHWLRPMIAFDSVEELVKTVTANISWVREHL